VFTYRVKVASSLSPFSESSIILLIWWAPQPVPPKRTWFLILPHHTWPPSLAVHIS
jgi:hypothetical protein